MRANVLRRRTLDNLEVAKRSEFDSEVLERLCSLINKQHIQNNVELMDLISLA